jgi:hypothetical protein
MMKRRYNAGAGAQHINDDSDAISHIFRINLSQGKIEIDRTFMSSINNFFIQGARILWP